MIGDIQDIHCLQCGKYLFTEKDTINGSKRENDYKNYVYDEENDEFICNKCESMFGFIWSRDYYEKRDTNN